MTTYAVTITNPGAESGTTTGWTDTGGSGSFSAVTTSPHSGTYNFRATGSLNDLTSRFGQVVTVAPEHEAIVDAGAELTVSCWHISGTNDLGRLYVELRDEDDVVLTSGQTALDDRAAWTQISVVLGTWPGTRKIFIEAQSTNNSNPDIQNTNRFDDFEAVLDDTPTTQINASQLGAYVWGNYSSADTRNSQAGAYVFGAAETSNTYHDVSAHQLGVYAWVRRYPTRRELRVFQFVQDDHHFYGVQLGDSITLIWDKYTGQWSNWVSPGYAYWRVNDAVDWEGMNLGGDPQSGKIWEIDPEGRLDYGDTPIRSVVTGGNSLRMRQSIPCYMAELTVSDANPSISDGTVGITLRTSDDQNQTFFSHGEILGEDLGDSTLFRWYGLGLMDSPGRTFEIIDTGYARRIEGLNIEVPDGEDT